MILDNRKQTPNQNLRVCSLHYVSSKITAVDIVANTVNISNLNVNNACESKLRLENRKQPLCIIRDCENRVRSKNRSKIEFYRFPKYNPELFAEWADACQLYGSERRKRPLYICGKHFEPDDIEKNTPPTLFLPGQSIPPVAPAPLPVEVTSSEDSAENANNSTKRRKLSEEKSADSKNGECKEKTNFRIEPIFDLVDTSIDTHLLNWNKIGHTDENPDTAAKLHQLIDARTELLKAQTVKVELEQELKTFSQKHQLEMIKIKMAIEKKKLSQIQRKSQKNGERRGCGSLKSIWELF